MNSVAFIIMAVVIVLSAIAVVSLHNPLYSALALVLNLLTVAGIFAILQAHFLATVQIIVYAGAIMVLVVFVLMLLNLKVELPTKKTRGIFIFSVVAGCLFLLIFVPLINEAFRVFPDPRNEVSGTIEKLGSILYTKYLFVFEAASILLMAAIAGAVMLARRRAK